MASDDGLDAAVAETERWFLRRGLPHFRADYSAREDIFTRAASLLILIFLVEVLGALNLDWVWWANAAALVAASGLVAVSWVAVNRIRGRPRFARPDDVGLPELAAFVAVPALLPLLFGGQVASAGVTLGANLAILAVVYLGTSYALVPMVRWAVGQSIRQLAGVAGLFARTLPLFLVFAMFVFINAEMWQVASDFVAFTFAGSVLALLLVGVVFVSSQLPRDVNAVADLVPADVPELCSDSPMAPYAEPTPSPELSARERGNAMLVMLVAQALQVAAVSLAIGGFFIAFGVLAVTPAVTEAWVGVDGAGVLLEFHWAGRRLVVTDSLAYVSGFLAAFAGLYFTVQAATEPQYRREVLGSVIGELREAVAVRAVYRGVVGARAGSRPD